MAGRRVVVVVAGFIAAACGASAGAGVAREGPSVHLASRPAPIQEGRAWKATLVTSGGGTPVLQARRGRTTLRARARRVRAHRFSARLRFPAAGSWQLAARLGRRRFPLGSIRVVPAAYALDQPAQVMLMDDGTALVAERGAKNRILQVDLQSGRFSVFATGIAAPWGLARAPDGSVIVSSETGIFRVPATGGRPTKIADVASSAILVSPGGDIYYGYLTEIGLIAAGSRTADVWPVDVSAPHGLAFAPGGDLIVSDTGNNRVLRVDPSSKKASVLASGFRAPLGLVAEPGGTFLVLEFDSGTLLRLDAAGGKSRVAAGLKKPYALARASDGTVYVVEAGELFPPSGRLRRVTKDGTVSTIQLRPGLPS